MGRILKSAIRTLNDCIALVLLLTAILTGCQNWHSGAGVPGLDSWDGDHKIMKNAKNDPFPTPQQVGLK